MNTPRSALAAIFWIGFATFSTSGLLAAPSVALTVLSQVTDEGKKLPAVSPETPAYYVLGTAAYHETGWPAPKNEMVRADLDGVLQSALAERGYLSAVDGRATTLVLVYNWGAHNLPDTDNAGLDSDSFTRNVLERAALAGGKTFATGLKAALRDATLMAATNSQGLAGTGGPAAIMTAQMSAKNDPVARFRERTDKNSFLFEQATADCFFVIVTAYSYDVATARRGALAWRANLTVRAGRLSQRQAYPLLIRKAGPSFGLPMTEPVTLRLSEKDATAQK